MYRWEIINHSTGEISESQRNFKSRGTAVKNAVDFVKDPISSVDPDHGITLTVLDNQGRIVGGLKDFQASRISDIHTGRLLEFSIDR